MYNKTTWVNKLTPLNATNMNHIEDGIFDAHKSIQEITDKGVGVITGIVPPTETTAASFIGQTYIDTIQGCGYQCVSIQGNVYKWVPLNTLITFYEENETV